MEPILTKDYTLDKKTVGKATETFIYIRKRTKIIIQAAVFLLFGIMFLVSAIKRPDVMQIFLTVVCFAFTLLVTLMPKYEASLSAEGYKKAQKFELLLFDDNLSVKRVDEERVELYYDEMKVLESREFYLVESDKRLFPIPKSVFTKQEKATFSEFLKAKLMARYLK